MSGIYAATYCPVEESGTLRIAFELINSCILQCFARCKQCELTASIHIGPFKSGELVAEIALDDTARNTFGQERGLPKAYAGAILQQVLIRLRHR